MSDTIYSYQWELKPLEKPTRLMIIEDQKTGLKYFCKTTNTGKNFENYFGSGVTWNRKTRKRRSDLKKIWVSDFFYDTSIVKFAMRFSRFNKIVESAEWANEKPENGLDGGWSHLPKDIQKQTAKARGAAGHKTKQSKEYIENVRPIKIAKWQESCDHEARTQKSNETMRTEEWKLENYKTCEHCGKGPMAPHNYSRWHGENCRRRTHGK